MGDYDAWSAAIGQKLDRLSSEKLSKLLEFNGLSDAEELKLRMARRFPGLNPETVLTDNPRLRNLLEGIEECGSGSYEKGPSHDKEPHDKSPGYDRGGFSKT